MKSNLLTFLILIIHGFCVFAYSQNSENEKLRMFISQTEMQQEPDQFQSNLDSIAKYIDIHDFVLKRLFNSCRTPVDHEFFEPYIEYACRKMDLRYKGSIKTMIIKGSVNPIDLPKIFNCMFETEEESCQFINSFEILTSDSIETAFVEIYLNYIELKRSKCLVQNLDSFEIQKKVFESHYELEYFEFDSLLIELSKYGDIHDYVLQRIGESRRTQDMHEYYPAFLNFICSNMDSVYRTKIIEMIEADSIQRFHAYPIVKYFLFETDEKICKFLNSQNFEEKFNTTNSLLYEGLFKLKKEMKCSM